MTAEFGTPAPLPGQPGFRVRPSESMAQEAAEMEERLAHLKTDLATEAEMREAAGPRKGGARWRSARRDRGSVRSYAKDVKIRHKQQLQQRPSHGIFAPGGKEVTRWGIEDTLEWLDSLGLGRHKGVFQQNEISGPILLEVGLDDLDYMSVRVLAHRKRILKGIEDLRRRSRKSLNPDKPPPPAPTPISVPRRRSCSETNCNYGQMHEETAAVVASAQRGREDFQGGDDPPSPGRRKQHRSTSKPLADNQTGDHGSERTPPPVNLADGQYNEDAARSDFAHAVAEWRGTGNSSATTTITATMATTSGTKGAAPSLHRPAVICRAPLAGVLIGAEEKRESSNLLEDRTPMIGKGLLGGQGRGSTGGAGECWTNPFASPSEGERLAAPKEEPPLRVRTLDAKKKEVRKGEHDDFPGLEEEAEHEAFQRAVANWNRSGSTTVACVPDSCDGRVLHQTNGRRFPETTIRVALPRRRTVEAMAEELREQMDAEHRLQAKDLEEKKRALLTGFESSRDERHEIEGESGGKKHGKNPICKDGQEVEDADDVGSQDERSDLSAASSSTSSSASLPAYRSGSESNEGMRVGGEDSERAKAKGRPIGVEIEVIESVLGVKLSTEGGMGYLVEEDGSSDELDLL
ncbi:unnamed protein product [Hapterophycus canaliculatus]